MRKLVVLLAVAALLAACAPGPLAISPVPGPEVGRPAPDFGWGDGSLVGLQGEVVLLVFWAPWCSMCHRQIPILQGIHGQYEDEGLVVIGVSKTSGQVEGTQTTFARLVDGEGELHTLYQVRGYPTLFLIDKGGVIRVREEGFMSRYHMEKALKKLLVSVQGEEG